MVWQLNNETSLGKNKTINYLHFIQNTIPNKHQSLVLHINDQTTYVTHLSDKALSLNVNFHWIFQNH